jgi:hypothetical protein
METLNLSLGREPQTGHRYIALFGAWCAMIFRLWRKTAVRCIRDNNAAWVAGPGRICFFGGWRLGYEYFGGREKAGLRRFGSSTCSRVVAAAFTAGMAIAALL